MKNSNITAIQKQLNNNFQTVMSFGKRIQKPLSKKRIELLEKQLEYARLMESKYLWTSIKLVDLNKPMDMSIPWIPNWKQFKVQGTYSFTKHGELN